MGAAPHRLRSSFPHVTNLLIPAGTDGPTIFSTPTQEVLDVHSSPVAFEREGAMLATHHAQLRAEMATLRVLPNPKLDVISLEP